VIPLVLFLWLLHEVDKREPRMRKVNAKLRAAALGHHSKLRAAALKK